MTQTHTHTNTQTFVTAAELAQLKATGVSVSFCPDFLEPTLRLLVENVQEDPEIWGLVV